MKDKLITPNQWAAKFKLRSCINNPKFAQQVQQIQDDAFRMGELAGIEKQKKLTGHQS